MVQPNLIHPVSITIRRKDDSNTFVDNDFREPIQQPARLSTITVNGQPKWFFESELIPGHGGISTETDGYVLFRRKDLDAVGVVLKLNDQFINIANIPVDLYIVKFSHEGNWPDQGGYTLLKAYFAERTPSRQNRGGP